MILSFTALNKQGQFRSFSCHISKLEVALDALSTIHSQGDALITAELVDEGNRMELPVDAFDGELLSNPIRQLEEQWQAVLSEPVRSVSTTTCWRAEMARQQLRLCNQRIDHYLKSINCLEWMRQQAEEAIYTEWRRTKMIRHYDTMLNQYYEYMERAKANQYVVQQRLNQLVC